MPRISLIARANKEKKKEKPAPEPPRNESPRDEPKPSRDEPPRDEPKPSRDEPPRDEPRQPRDEPPRNEPPRNEPPRNEPPRNEPRQPRDEPRQPRPTRDEPRQPRTTRDEPRQPRTTRDEPRSTRDEPRNLQTPRDLRNENWLPRLEIIPPRVPAKDWIQMEERRRSDVETLTRRDKRRNQAQIDAEFDDGVGNPSDTFIGRFETELQAYVNAFDRTGLTEEEIKERRRTLRREYLTNLYATMTEEEIAQFREMRFQNRYATATEEMKMEYQRRQAERTQAQIDRDMARNATILNLNATKIAKAQQSGVIKERPVAFTNIPPARAKLAQMIVEPRFQVARHLDTMVREMYVANPGAIPLTMLAQATQLATTPVTGRTFFPPQNANPTIVYPFRARFVPPSKPLPRYMNWADTQNVAAVRGWKLPKVRLSRARRVSSDTQGYMHEVVDQLGCGSCWVISVAGAMSDRASIWTQQPNPQLSITNILGCVSGDGKEGPTVAGAAMYSPATAGCAGGLPMGAVEMFARFGDATSSCVGYDWCSNDPVCGATQRLGFADSPKYLNSIIPACADMLKSCLTCENGKCETASMPRNTWTLKTYSSGRPYILLTDVLSIQQEIAAHGPVVATHAIYADFQNGTAAILGDGWSKTRGVYCNVQTTSASRPYNGTRYAGTESQMIGYHAVIIVGWGIEPNVPDWTNPESTIDIPYWIVRNSWSTAWNPDCVINGIKMPGYCKIAFTDHARNINTKLYLDNTDDGMAGAAIAFMPMLVRVNPERRGESQVDENPTMFEESLDTGDVNPMLVGSAQMTDMTPDPDELRRDEINHPIICEAETFNVNCDPRVRLFRTSQPPNHMSYSFISIVTLVAAAGIILFIFFIKRQK